MTKDNLEGCDGVLWYATYNQDSYDVEATIYRYKDRFTEPNELGFKYYILTYKEDDENSPEIMAAYIGDIHHFITNHVKAGYHGLMVKDKVIPKKDIKGMFKKILSNWSFPDSVIRSVIRQV